MKKNYLFTFFLFATSSLFAQMGQIQNGGFENWSMSTIYEYPTQWGNSNVDEWRGVPTVLKSTDAAGGTYSCEINANVVGPDTLFGYVFHGGIGQSGPESGIAYTDLFNEVRFQYKSDLNTGDSLYLIYIRFVASTMVEMNVLPAVNGIHSTWTQGSVTVPSTAQDELFIGFVMGDPFSGLSPTPGSWARIDDVQLFNTGVAVTAVPDPGFEQWSSQTVETPDNWYTFNEMLAGIGMENANKTTDANTGTYAIEMTVVQEPTYGDTITSFISMGPFDMNSMGNPFLPAPYNATPTTFSGAYKYVPSNGDSNSGIQIMFFQAGTPVGMHTEPLPSSAGWTTFSSPLTITGTPDSIVFAVMAGQNPGSVLKLDDLSFSGGDVSIEEFKKMNISIYPNPANEYVMVKSDGIYNITFIDLAGNIVLEKMNLNGAHNVNISEMSRGAYILKISNNEQVQSLRFIKE